MSLRRDIEDLIEWCLDNGMPVAKTRNGHWRVETPTGPVFMPSTPSDKRGVKNARSLLRRKLREAGWPDDQLP